MKSNLSDVSDLYFCQEIACLNAGTLPYDLDLPIWRNGRPDHCPFNRQAALKTGYCQARYHGIVLPVVPATPTPFTSIVLELIAV